MHSFIARLHNLRWFSHLEPHVLFRVYCDWADWLQINNGWQRLDTCHVWTDIHQPSHGNRHPSPFTCWPSLVNCHIHTVIRHLSHVNHRPSHIPGTYHLSLATCHPSPPPDITHRHTSAPPAVMSPSHPSFTHATRHSQPQPISYHPPPVNANCQ